MNRERWYEMAEAFSLVSLSASSDETLCTCCRDLLGAVGVAISLASSFDLESMCATNASIARFEDLEFTLGEGPAAEALASGEPSFTGFLPGENSTEWSALESATDAAGLARVYAYPLNIGAARLGVLTLFLDPASRLSAAQHDDALMAADALVHVILAGLSSRSDGLGLDSIRDVGSFRAEIHQASGMLSEQISCTVPDALVQLRGRAFALAMPIKEVAHDVILRRTWVQRTLDNQIEWVGAE